MNFIAKASSRFLYITVKVASSGTSTDNFAEVWLSDQFDIDSTPGNGDVGEDDSTNEEVLVADLSLTQTSDISGSNAVFTVRVTNAGPDDASGVVVSNSRLSNIANYTYISSSATGGTTYNPLNGDWTIGSLPVGTTVTLVVTTIIVVIDENLAEISAVTEVDPDSLPDNNSRTEDDDAATPSANLSLTKTVSNINPEVNTNIIFTVRVSNAGYATATNVEVKDILPSGLTYVSHTSGQTYNSSTGIWSVGTISNGGLREIQITALVATYGIRTNNAEVWKSDQSDPNSDPGDSSTTEDDDDSVTIVTRRAILLNEIAWAGTGTGSLAEDEWIELYNPSDASITISGWTIRKNSCAGSVYITIDSGKSVARDGYFLLERGDDDTVGGVAANQIYTTSVTKLDDAGETLYLCDNSGNQIDTANQQGFSAPPNPWPAGTASSPYGSMERQGNSAEQDSVWVTNRGGTKNGTTAAGGSIYGTPGKKNSTGNSFPTTATVEPTDTPTPLPGTVSIPPRPIINEIHARPGFDWNQDGRADVFDEFIEIKNLTAVDISLSGWKLDTVNGKKSFTLPDVTLKPGERIVYYSKETNLLLSDGGETVRLSNASGKIYDAFTYTVARAEDQSFCRLPDGNPGDSWFEDCVPTPNLTNTREGQTPASPNGNASPVCNLPDTIPLDFFIPECNGYGADIWNPYYWDFANWIDKLWIQQTNEKWRTFIE
ncbi:MAG: lamin tail domain-containing protein [Anaerolineales bacterium]|nr:lamin tail domain-containing protein [Anaerolineales bacterium]